MKNIERERFIIDRIREHYIHIKDDYDVLFLGLQGSQNYGLDIYDEEYKSDIDTKAIILPSFEDFVYNRTPVSKTIVLENNEHIDIKDIRLMFENFKKQNINFIEILFSKYKIINKYYSDLVQLLLNNRESIARLNYNQSLRAIAGMSMEKMKALQTPYPLTASKIEKYGYDPKQLYHILRLNDFIKNYVVDEPYEECLISKRSLYLKEIKKGVLPVDEAVKLAEKTDADTKRIKDKFLKEREEINKNAIQILDYVKLEILKRKFKKELEK